MVVLLLPNTVDKAHCVSCGSISNRFDCAENMTGKGSAKLAHCLFICRVIIPCPNVTQQCGMCHVGRIPNEDIEHKHDMPPDNNDLIGVDYMIRF